MCTHFCVCVALLVLLCVRVQESETTAKKIHRETTTSRREVQMASPNGISPWSLVVVVVCGSHAIHVWTLPDGMTCRSLLYVRIVLTVLVLVEYQVLLGSETWIEFIRPFIGRTPRRLNPEELVKQRIEIHPLYTTLPLSKLSNAI